MLIKKGSEEGIVGLDIGTAGIKLVQLDKSTSPPRLLNFGMVPLEQDVIVDGSIINRMAAVRAIRNLLESEKITTKECTIGVSGRAVIAKKINVPIMTERELEQSISFEAEQYIPEDISEVNIDFQILTPPDQLPPEEETMEVLLVAVRRDKIEERLSLAMEAGLVPRVVDIDALAIENAFELNHPEEVEGKAEGEGEGEGGEEEGGESAPRENRIVALVDIGADLLNINILKNGVTTYIRDISNFGGNRYTEAIQKELNVSAYQAESLKLGVPLSGFSPLKVSPIITWVTEEIGREINKSFEFFRTNFGEEDIHKIVLTGGCAKIKGMDKFLSETLYIETEIADPFDNIEVNEKGFDPEFIHEMGPLAAVSVGLALRSLED